MPSVVCKTDKGLPEDAGADTCVFGADELVPTGSSRPDAEGRHSYLVEGFRPRVEAAYARIERWTDRLDGVAHWRATTANNVSSIYGRRATARIADPAHPERIFEWLIEETRDDRGEVIGYEYVAEDPRGVDVTAPHEADRVRGGIFAQRHLERIGYAHRVPGQAGPWLRVASRARAATSERLRQVFDRV